MGDTVMLRRFLVVCAAVAAIVLGVVVLVGAPTNSLDLLAGAGIASGAGLLVLLI
jgi:hypothetical protein